LKVGSIYKFLPIRLEEVPKTEKKINDVFFSMKKDVNFELTTYLSNILFNFLIIW